MCETEVEQSFAELEKRRDRDSGLAPLPGSTIVWRKLSQSWNKKKTGSAKPLLRSKELMLSAAPGS